MKQRQFLWLILYLWTTISYGETFGNFSISFPQFGLVLLDPLALKHQSKWHLKRQYLLGGETKAALGYEWWGFSNIYTSMGKNTLDSRLITSLNTSFGFLWQKSFLSGRPVLGGGLSYFHVFYPSDMRFLWPSFWFGPMLIAAYEWVIASEISLSIGANYYFYINLNNPFRHVVASLVAINFYF